MKIIHFIGSIHKNSGGTATYIQQLATGLVQYADVIVVTSKCLNPIELHGVEVYELDFSLLRWWSLKSKFLSILKNEEPDLVHINGIWDPQNWLFQQVCISQGIKVLLSPHGMLEPYILKRNLLKKRIALTLYQKRAIKSVDYLHATASAELTQIRKLGFSSPAQIIPNGIDVSEVIMQSDGESPEPDKNILFLSRIHPKKGLEILIEAVDLLNEPNIKVTIAGEGEDVYIDQLKKLCVEKRVDHLFNFIGGVYEKQKWKLYSQADLFVLPTYSENFGIVIIEALAAGVPVITTKGTPWEELVVNQCGWWIELSVPNLLGAIKEALALSKKDRARMKEKGIHLVQQKYQIQAVVQNTFEFYKNIVSTEINSYTYSNK